MSTAQVVFCRLAAPLSPSWLSHEVELNEKATTDRISISFNIFIKGTLGDQKQLNELILK